MDPATTEPSDVLQWQAEERISGLTIFRIAALEWLAAVDISSRASANTRAQTEQFRRVQFQIAPIHSVLSSNWIK